MLKGKRILLIVAGGIAAFKSLELIRRLRERGAAVRCVLTDAGAKFVTPLSLQALSEDRVYSDMFSLTDESEMGHIQLSRDADLLVVEPATANLLARMAAGLADDLAATVLLATDTPVLAAPATDISTQPFFWSSFNISPRRQQRGGWAREVTQSDFAISDEIAGVNMYLEPGGIRRRKRGCGRLGGQSHECQEEQHGSGSLQHQGCLIRRLAVV